jgi:acyl carrier protein
MNENDLIRVKVVFSNIFNIGVDDIDNTIALHTLPDWDSLKHMSIIAALEEEFSVEFDQPEIESMINFEIVCATLGAYLDS